MVTNPLKFKLRTQLIIVMLSMLVLFAGSIAYLQQVAEEKVLDLIQDEINGMMKAVEISMEQIHAAGKTDEARLKDFIEHLQKRGVEEISILSKRQEVMLSSNPQLVGSRLSVSKNEFLIQANIGEKEGAKPKKLYSAFAPIILKGKLEGYIHISVYFEDLEKLSREMLYQRIAWALPIVGVGLILCILIADRYTKPIPVLIEAIHSISRGNRPNLPTNLHADISGLSDSLDAMSKMLAAQKSLEEKLKRSERQAIQAQLASGIAHEIRNPLNFISLSVDHLGNLKSFDRAECEAAPADLIRKIKTEIQRINQMVTNFLDLGREFVLRPLLLRADLSVEEALGLNSQLLRDHGISVERDYCDPIPVVEIDIDKMTSCFQNLIVNAADAMPTGGILRIVIMESAGSVNMVLEDGGEGIRPDNLPKLYEPYFTTKRKGIGLGLAIAKRIVESHMGSIDITSAPGKGTRVRVSLPSAPRRQ
jgi:signal transduction histidine kinase